jgi:hypothetical protein
MARRSRPYLIGAAVCPPTQPGVRAGRRGRYLAETWGRCAAPSRPLVTALCYDRIRARAAGSKVLVNARIMARRSRP